MHLVEDGTTQARPIRVRVSKELYDRLEAIGREREYSMSGMVRKALMAYATCHEQSTASEMKQVDLVAAVDDFLSTKKDELRAMYAAKRKREREETGNGPP